MMKRSSPGRSDNPERDLRPIPRSQERWFVLALMSILLYGVYYAYNSVVPLADSIIKAFGVSRAQYGFLFSYYSIPNFVCMSSGDSRFAC
jgi:hypothetical protein